MPFALQGVSDEATGWASGWPVGPDGNDNSGMMECGGADAASPGGMGNDNRMTQMDFPNILVCDVGNSRIAMAQACGNEVHNSRREGVCCVAELAAAMKELWEGVERPAGIAASSVSPKGLELLEAAAE